MRTTTPRAFGATFAAALLLAATHASAADPAAQAAGAALFQDAKQLVAKGDYEHACPKFAEAQRLFPTAGTLLNLGDCYEKQGKLASAWGAFKDAEVTARTLNDSDREQEASRRGSALTPQLAKLAIVVPPAARVSGFELRRDGILVGDGQWGTPLPVDVGWHKIEATAPGRKPWSTVVRVETNATSASIEVPVLEVAPADSAAPAFWSARRTAAIAIGSVGFAGTILGAVAGGLALSKAASSKSHCHPLGDATACDATGLSLRHDTRVLGNVANVALAFSGAAIVTGIVLFATAPPSSDTKPKTAARLRARVAVSANGLSIEGAW